MGDTDTHTVGEVLRVVERKRRSAAARRGWDTRRARINETLNTVAELAEYARETARGLRQWSRTGCTSPGNCGMPEPCMHAERAANRMDKLAERLSSSKRSKRED
jgi:hypothetical protein